MNSIAQSAKTIALRTSRPKIFQFCLLDIWVWNLFGICNLEFGV